MIEVPEELIETVNRGEEFVAVAQVVLAELARSIAERLQQVGDRRIFLLQAERCAGQANLGQAGADGRLAGDERGPAGRAALLAIPVRAQRAFSGEPVDVGRL